MKSKYSSYNDNFYDEEDYEEMHDSYDDDYNDLVDEEDDEYEDFIEDEYDERDY